MKAANPSHLQGDQQGQSPRAGRFRRVLTTTLLLAAAGLPLTGCLSVRTRTVDKTVIAPNVREATLDELRKRMTDQYNDVRSLQLIVDIAATEGGARQGKVKELPSFRGIILLRKPSDLRVIMQLPVVGSRALEMVSDGKDFKLLIAAGNARAIVGSESVTTPSKNGLENLRPGIIRDALQIPPVGPDEFVTLTNDSRILAPARGHKEEAVEEPAYVISVLRSKGKSQELELVRTIHLSRVTLLPYEQDLYDEHGRLVTTISYSKYQHFGELDYPMSILITRPIDEYTLKIDLTKLTLNPPLDDEQFALVIPPNIPVQKM